MKEIMVIKDEEAIDEWNRTIAQFIDVDNKIYKAEFIKVPETWEELKELCKDIKEVTITEEGHINVDLVYFTKDGEIYAYVEGVLTSSIFLPVSKDRTPQQMWQIIKSLIGE